MCRVMVTPLSSGQRPVLTNQPRGIQTVPHVVTAFCLLLEANDMRKRSRPHETYCYRCAGVCRNGPSDSRDLLFNVLGPTQACTVWQQSRHLSRTHRNCHITMYRRNKHKAWIYARGTMKNATGLPTRLFNTCA